MHIHILGICGKFMCGIAIIAKQMGFKVTGSDQNILAPIAEMLSSFDICVTQGYEADTLDKDADCVVIGNALSRGRSVIERILNENIPYFSGPEWLSIHLLKKRWVIAVSGTHGKTTTSSMIAWILEQAGYNPGFLIGGNPSNFDFSARYTDSNFFVIEADEYDTAFFDKRSKFLHYHPKTLIINNLEFDHADIFASLDDIKRQFSQLLRIVPGNGLIVVPATDANVQSLFVDASFTPRQTLAGFDAEWNAEKIAPDGSEFRILHQQKAVGTISWDLIGEHNINNALAAIVATRHVGVTPTLAINSLGTFRGVKRRLELKGIARDIHVYDDFAHHPTAIATTLAGLRTRVRKQRIFAVLEFGSNTMRSNHHATTLSQSFKDADFVVLLQPQRSNRNLQSILQELTQPVIIFDTVSDIITYLAANCKPGDHVLCMSNLTFDGIHEQLLHRLESAQGNLGSVKK